MSDGYRLLDGISRLHLNKMCVWFWSTLVVFNSNHAHEFAFNIAQLRLYITNRNIIKKRSYNKNVSCTFQRPMVIIIIVFSARTPRPVAFRSPIFHLLRYVAARKTFRKRKPPTAVDAVVNGSRSWNPRSAARARQPIIHANVARIRSSGFRGTANRLSPTKQYRSTRSPEPTYRC